MKITINKFRLCKPKYKVVWLRYEDGGYSLHIYFYKYIINFWSV